MDTLIHYQMIEGRLITSKYPVTRMTDHYVHTKYRRVPWSALNQVKGGHAYLLNPSPEEAFLVRLRLAGLSDRPKEVPIAKLDPAPPFEGIGLVPVPGKTNKWRML